MHLPQFGQYQVQIFISLTLVMGGLLVALICDYLKGTNEQLREQNVALRIQRAQERRRMLTARSRSARMVALQQPAVNEAVTAPADSLAPSLIAPSLLSGAKTEMAIVAAPTHPEAAQTVGVATGGIRPSRSNGASRRPISADALAAMERGAARAAAKRPAASVVEVSANVAEEVALPLGVP